MAEPRSIALVGATGLIGRTVMTSIIDRDDVTLTGIARRETPLPQGVKMRMVIADPERWDEVIADVRPQALICALGTTWKKAGKDEETFRSVDHDLVLSVAEAAVKAGTENLVVVSSVSADAASKHFYMRVKGETERALAKVGVKRLDILQPGLLRGPRIDDPRAGEGIAQILSPIFEPLMIGGLRNLRSIKAEVVASGALALAKRKAAGRFTHNNDGIRRAAREW